MRLAMQMSLQESQPAPRQPALSYPQGVSGGDDDDPALRAALAASMAEAPRVHEAGGETRMRPAAVGWVAGAPPPPQVDTEATLLHRPRAPRPACGSPFGGPEPSPQRAGCPAAVHACPHHRPDFPASAPSVGGAADSCGATPTTPRADFSGRRGAPREP